MSLLRRHSLHQFLKVTSRCFPSSHHGYPPKDTGFSLMTALTDPDGNCIEFAQLSDRWFKHLESRKQKGIDVVSRWQKSKS